MKPNFLSIWFFLAPGLMLVSDLLAYINHNQYFWLRSILFWLSFFGFLFLIYGMWKLSEESNYDTLSAVIAIFGTLIGITIIGMERYAWGVSMEGVSAEMIRNAHHNPWVFFTSRAAGITFPIGLIMLSIGLYKNKTISLPVLIGLAVSIILFPVGRIPKELIFNVTGDTLMIVSFGMVGKAYQKKLNSKKNNETA